MTENEYELLHIINENVNPEQAVQTAIKVFAAFLEQLEADQVPQAVCPRGSS
jgi:hypothetical protein